MRQLQPLLPRRQGSCARAALSSCRSSSSNYGMSGQLCNETDSTAASSLQQQSWQRRPQRQQPWASWSAEQRRGGPFSLYYSSVQLLLPLLLAAV